MGEQLKEVLLNIDGLDERFANLIIKYVEKYIDMSTNKSLVATNLIQQIKKNITGINFKNLDGISGCVSGLGSSITIDSNLEDWVIDNTFLHEFTHQISRNEYAEKDEDGHIDYIQTNLGLKVAFDQSMEFSMGARLKNWETDGNNYAFNKGIVTFDEWITEWLANKMSDFNNVEVKEDSNGFFRKKTCHGYDGSNVMNMLELVYGTENIANLLTGFDLNEDERKKVIPIKEFHKLNEMIDSSVVLSEEEINIFKNLQPPYMQTPNITGLIIYYVSQYQKQDSLENYNVIIQKMLDVLTRAYSINFNNRIDNCTSIDGLQQIYNELSVIQNSMIWTENQSQLDSLETYKLYDEMRNKFSKQLTNLGISNDKFVILFLTPSQLLEKFNVEELELKQLHGTSLTSTQKM